MFTPRRRTIESLKKEAKQWLAALRAGAADARAKFTRALPTGPANPTLRDVQFALARLDSLQRVTFDNCHRLTDTGIAHHARLPRLAYLRVNSHGVTRDARTAFGVTVEVDIEG